MNQFSQMPQPRSSQNIQSRVNSNHTGSLTSTTSNHIMSSFQLPETNQAQQQNSTTYTPYSYAFPSFSRPINPINTTSTYGNQNLYTSTHNLLQSHGNPNVQYINQTIHSLPPFDGSPENWPFFISQYNESTRQYNYTPLQNTSRLSQALTGEALNSVKCFLINPNNTEHVINTLEFLFGRSELILDSELRKIKKISNIIESNIKEVIPFSIKIQQLVCVQELLPNKSQHLNNPILLREVVDKLFQNENYGTITL